MVVLFSQHGREISAFTLRSMVFESARDVPLLQSTFHVDGDFGNDQGTSREYVCAALEETNTRKKLPNLLL